MSHSLLRAASLVVGSIDIVMVAVQAMTGPAGKTLTVLGAIITLPTIYAGFAVLGFAAVLYGGWPLVKRMRLAQMAERDRALADAKRKEATLRDAKRKEATLRENTVRMLEFVRSFAGTGGLFADYPDEEAETF